MLNPPEKTQSPVFETFDKSLASATAQYSCVILDYILIRYPNDFSDNLGNITKDFLNNVVYAKPEFYSLYWNILSSIVSCLLKYSSLEERCSLSSYHIKDRDLMVSILIREISKFESSEQLQNYLSAMLEESE